MRASEPEPGGQWPSEMTIRVEHSPQTLAFLLFVRSAWKLPVSGVPALSITPDVGASELPPGMDVQVAVERWILDWNRAWEPFGPRLHAISTPDAATQHLLDTLTDAELWDAISIDSSRFWARGIDRVAFTRWHQDVQNGHRSEGLPEHDCVDALVPAWRSGLTTVVQMPYSGLFAERINPEHLVVSATTRGTPTHYRRALAL
ncbi:MAG: hypothetical protein JWQ43_3072 [Glaciihabitans sp.]|nr:hypothetical protein [Glaciihabitans sp.]